MGAYRSVLELRAARMVFLDAGNSDQGIETQLELARQVDAAAAACESDVTHLVASSTTSHSRSGDDGCTEGKKCRRCERLFSGAWMTAVRETQSMRAAFKAVESRIARLATIGVMHELDEIRRDICQVLYRSLAAGIGVSELVFRDEDRRPFLSLSGPNIQPPGGAFITVSP